MTVTICFVSFLLLFAVVLRLDEEIVGGDQDGDQDGDRKWRPQMARLLLRNGPRFPFGVGAGGGGGGGGGGK